MPFTPPRLPRVVHVYKDIYPPVEGGIERIIHLLATLMAGRYDVRALVAAPGKRGGPGGERSAAGVPVTEVRSLGRAFSTPLAPGFRAALRRSGADLFHFHIPHPTGEIAWLLSGLRTPAVATYHSDVVRQRWLMPLYGPLFGRFLDRLDRIMPTSRRYLETSPWLAPRRDKCTVVPLGYPLEEYAPTPEIERRAAELRARHGRFVLFLGCLRRYKGLPHLLAALERLPGVAAIIAGDGPEREGLVRLTGEKGLTGRVTFAGHVSAQEAVALLHAAKVFVLPSDQRSEAFGLCQIEAMACGLPVISTDLPTGVPEVNRDGESGLIVPPGDPGALAQAVRRLFDDEALRSKLGEGGRARARGYYGVERMVENVAGVYEAILRSKTE